MKKRTGLNICANLIGLVRPLTGFMLGAIAMGIAGHLCATFITIFGGYALLGLLGIPTPLPIQGLFIGVGIFALARGILRYGEQACNHYIAFKLLALIRDKVFQALRRLCPAKLEGRDKGDLISVITSDIELLEVFYAHTISPTVIAVLMSLVMVIFIGHYHPILGFLAAAAYIVIGGVVPIFTSKASKDYGLRFRNGSGELIDTDQWFNCQGPNTVGSLCADGSAWANGWGDIGITTEFREWAAARGETIRATTSFLLAGEYTPDGDYIGPQTNPVNTDCWNGKVYTPTTQLTDGRTKYGTNNNVRILRYADVLLMNAEAKVMLGENGDEPFNLVRERAQMPPITGVTLQDIKDERRMEFGAEGLAPGIEQRTLLVVVGD